jgi:hypothetical protein
MKEGVKQLKIQALNAKINFLLKDLKELRSKMNSWYNSFAPHLANKNEFFDLVYGPYVKNFKNSLKDQNKILKKLSTLNKKRRVLKNKK